MLVLPASAMGRVLFMKVWKLVAETALPSGFSALRARSSAACVTPYFRSTARILRRTSLHESYTGMRPSELGASGSDVTDDTSRAGESPLVFLARGAAASAVPSDLRFLDFVVVAGGAVFCVVGCLSSQTRPDWM